jgi:hypothetical protein
MPYDREYSLHDVEFIYENYRDLGLEECARILNRPTDLLRRYIVKLRRRAILLKDHEAAERYGHPVQVVMQSAAKTMKRTKTVVAQIPLEEEFDPIPDWLRIMPRDFAIPDYAQ